MDSSARLQLPYLLPNQAQKHVTLNDALRRLDALVQMRVIASDVVAQPVAPLEGDAYLVPASATGAAWSEKAEGVLAVFQDGAWTFITPGTGWMVFDAARGQLMLHDGTGWGDLTDRTVARIGINTVADDSNRLAVKTDVELLSHDDVTPGSGDARKVINKADAGNTASVLFQTGFSGRAEFGLAGDDDFHIKVSADGGTWKEAVQIGRADGVMRFPQGIAHVESGLLVAQYVPSPVRQIWRLDTSRPATPRTYTLGGVSGTTLTLSAAEADAVFSDGMRGNVAVRIWNTSKSPAEAAWVDWNISTTDLRVTDAAHVAGWANGDVIRLGDPDPTGENELEMVALDISGYLASQLGAVFPQRGVMLGLYVSSSDGSAELAASANGAMGTAFGANALSDGTRNAMATPVLTTELSPISNSHLVFLREKLYGGATDLVTTFARVLGVFA
ncbi:DUF2793 domain-containing protein [Hyphomonas johnsonii]|uniref:DUF2793 domain-containing protein n=1 Tax=Hyphomonas johnsonii MHS-2 TaxID=1280950 RepID=A0A059FAK1_9PROT|nr:DUF2793 domain-containing protein [Hyphomonas johnsonii]KCZ87576.1 hypothetical protein HJO_16425 [Hyphomonas johnsonii MHS-2]